MSQEVNKNNPQHMSRNLDNILVTLLAIQLVVVVLAFFSSLLLGIVASFIFILTVVLVIYFRNRWTTTMDAYIENLSSRIARGEQEALIKLPMGMMILNEDNHIEWANPYLIRQIEGESLIGEDLEELNEELYQAYQKMEKANDSFEFFWKDQVYRVFILDDPQILYFMDITDYALAKIDFEKNQTVIGFLVLDNYDELVKQLDDKETSRMNSMITTYFSNLFEDRDVYYKRLEDDRYFVLMTCEELEHFEEDNFSFIDQLRERSSKRNMPITISFGLAYDNDSFVANADAASNNVDLALGRGGDQAIVKKADEEPRYYGGNSNPMVKRTRVRSRMVTQVLESLMAESDEIFVMGHQQPDLDAIGSSFGIRRIAEINELDCWVVIDEDDLNTDVAKLVEAAKETESVGPYIISPEEAARKCSSQSLVILVDHHKPSMSIALRLIEISDRVVVIDHHRRGSEFPEDPILVYIEPYASSAGELVTEMFEYVTGNGKPINRLEATALLGGIIVDTNNFSLRTGSRTYNAASFLQSVGANNTMIQTLLEEDPEVYIERSHLVGRMEVYDQRFAVTTGEEDEVYSSVMTAQVADQMLKFTNIQASFAITKRADGRVGISARSLGEINVQVIMEEMGGGGHLSNAATQIDDLSVEEVKEQLLSILQDRYQEEEK